MIEKEINEKMSARNLVILLRLFFRSDHYIFHIRIVTGLKMLSKSNLLLTSDTFSLQLTVHVPEAALLNTWTT